MPGTPAVTAVLVSHEGAHWLPEVLAAVEAQTVRPQRLVAADTGSQDGSAALLRRACPHVLDLPVSTGYGSAVTAALATLPPEKGPADSSWIWLLHDDAAPRPDALEALLAYAADSPSAVLLGPKVVDWAEPRVLVELGLTTDPTGHRTTGLERREYDQGQHDAPRDVLAVGTAGALVRRDVWETLGGLDPRLPLFRDDLDLGWRVNAAGHRAVVVPTAVVRHVRAATTGRRSLPAATGRPPALDRRHAVFVLLAHAAGLRLLLALAWLLPGAVLRSLGFLLARRPRAAADEIASVAAVLGRPRTLHEARRRRTATRTVPPSALRPLLASPWTRARGHVASVVDRVAGGAATRSDPLGGLGEIVPASQTGGVRAALRRPGVLLVLGLSLLALVTERRLLGDGVLAGGQLLPAPEGASDLWAAYAARGQAWLAVLAMLSTVLLGKAWLAVDLLLLASVPLSGAVAYAVSGRVVRSQALRVWAGATWALLPVGTGAIASGRLGAAAAQVALPAVLLALHVVTSRGPRVGWSTIWGTGLALAVLVVLAPTVWPLLAGLLMATAGLGIVSAAPARRPAARRRALACAAVAALPLLWSYGLLDLPEEAARLDVWSLVLLTPEGPGTPPSLVCAGLLLAALGALARTSRARVVAAGWGLALAGLAYAVVLSQLRLWPGSGLQVAAAGMILAALVGADGLGDRLAAAAFGRRQLTAVLLVVVAAVVPLLCAAAWLDGGADGPLRRGPASVLPAFVRAELAVSPGRSALVLAPGADGVVGYALSGPDGVRLGDPAVPQLDDAVADLLSPRGSAASSALAARGVRFVALSDPAPQLVAALDAQAGLSREVGERPRLWRVTVAGPRIPALPEPSRTPVIVGQGLALLVVAILAGPRPRPRRGLELERRS